jgi:hypothetical protein
MKTTISKKRYIYLLLILLCIIAWGSCSKDFLDVEPVAALNSASFYKTMEDADQAVTAAYSQFLSVATWDRNLIMTYGDISSDDAEAGGEWVNEVPEFEAVNRLTHRPEDGALATTYGVLFRAIYLSNLAMEKIPGVKNTDPDADPAIIDIRMAELKFLRAVNFLYLTNVYGAVPLVDHVLAPSEYTLGRSTFNDLFELIEKDLKEAIPVLPEKNEVAPEDIGRANKGAAKAFLAKLLLFESSYAHYYPGDERFEGLTARWQEVLDYCEEIIESDIYSLYGANGETYDCWRGPETDGFRYAFTTNTDNGDESVFDIQCIQDNLNYADARGTSMTHWTGPRSYYNANGVRDITGMWGLGLPSYHLAAAFEPGDPRFAATISVPGDTMEMEGPDQYFLISFEMSESNMYQRKWEVDYNEYNAKSAPTWHGSPINVRLMRYSEVLLMAAEAAMMLNNHAKARSYINEVRTRARNCGSTGVPADYTGNISLDRLVNERRVELALEGKRFFDLVRWNLAVEYLNDTTADGWPVIFESPKHDFFPLPAREVILSKGNLKQYPGWD